MVCHFSLKEMASSLSSKKYCMSSSNRSACPKLFKIRTPYPLVQFRIEELARSGLSPNIKTLCQPWKGGANEKAMLEPTSLAGLGLEEGS